MIVGPAIPMPMTPMCGGASARAISSRKMACCVYRAPPPPYSSGQMSPTYPASYRDRLHARISGASNRVAPPRWPCSPGGRFSSSQARRSVRNAASSGVSRRSIWADPSRPNRGRQRRRSREQEQRDGADGEVAHGREPTPVGLALRGCQSVTRTYKPLTGGSGLLQKYGGRWDMVEGGSVRPLDARAHRIGLALAIVLIAGAVGVGCAYPSAVQPACADAVIEDWTNGALDSKYALECYD